MSMFQDGDFSLLAFFVSLHLGTLLFFLSFMFLTVLSPYGYRKDHRALLSGFSPYSHRNIVHVSQGFLPAVIEKIIQHSFHSTDTKSNIPFTDLFSSCYHSCLPFRRLSCHSSPNIYTSFTHLVWTIFLPLIISYLNLGRE